MAKTARQRKDDEQRRSKYEESKKAKRRRVELKTVPRTVQGTTSTKKAATASTATKGKQPERAPSIPPPPPPRPENDRNGIDNTGDNNAGAHLDGGSPSEHSSSERSQSQSRSPSPLAIPPLSSTKRKRIQAATGLTEDELEERRHKLRRTLDIMEYDVATKLVSQGKDIDEYHEQARLVPRTVHPFINVLDVLMFGRTYREEDFDWDMDDEDGEEEGNEDDEDDEDDEDGESPKAKRARELAQKKELFYQYNALLDIIPDLKTDIHILTDDDIECLAAYIQRECGKARSTDSSHFLNRILVYYRAGSDIDCAKMPAVLEKSRRGWDNYYTARALMPLNALPAFTKNWKKWCQLIQNCKVHVVADDWPSILFDLDGLDLDVEPGDDMDFLSGCLRGPAYSMAVKSLLTGPISATTPGGRPEKLPGKPPLAIQYKLKTVTPRFLAYVAVLVRHSLVKGDWAVMDKEFNNHDFYDSIVSQFKEPLTPWASEILEWYNWEVFGNMSRKTNKKLTAGRKTMAQLVRSAAKKGYTYSAPEPQCSSTPEPPPTDAPTGSSDDPTEGLYADDLPPEDSAKQAETTEDAPHAEELVPKSPVPVSEEASSSSGTS